MTKVSENEILQSNVRSSGVLHVARSPRRLGLNARKVISKRYSLKDAKGQVARRVARHRAPRGRLTSRLPRRIRRSAISFFKAMSDVMLAREFVPNTPCLVNAGKPTASSPLALCSTCRIRSPASWTRERRRDHSSDRRRHRHDL